MLTAQGLGCVRGDRLLFKNVGFRLKAGGLLHVRGENGSGKSSLLRMLCGLLPPEAGDVMWNGEDIRHHADTYRANLLYIGHLNALKDDLSAAENLIISSRLSGQGHEMNEVHAALQAVGLARCADLPVRNLSQGQKRRVSLARLWLSNASLWILDEPFAALDTAAIEIVSRRIGEHLATGGITILTTHQEVNITAAAMQELRLTQ
jgi:heme exporter protein A